MSKRHSIFLTLFIFLAGVQVALGASVTITPAGNGLFDIQGAGLNGIQGIELNIVYDSSSLASPSVSQGNLISGAMMVVNTSNPGTIKIDIISSPKSIAGSGQIVSISFASHTGTGGVTVSPSMINGSAAPVPAGGKVSAVDFQKSASDSTGFYTSPGIPFGGSTDTTPTNSRTTTPPATTGQATGGSAPTALGTVSMPSDIQTGGSTKPADITGVPDKPAEPDAVKPGVTPAAGEKAVSEPKPPVKVTVTSYQGALENFRAHRGEKSPAILLGLLNREISPTIHQEPALALSDGKSTVKIIAEASVGKSPKFMLTGAELVTLSKDDSSGTWIIEALPNNGVLQASLTIMTDSATIDYPLTLAPPVAGISTVEADFAAFLKDSGSSKPKRDLNGDGRHDYQDDFIYAVNYRLNKDSVGKAKK